jgi:UDP-N-acetylmuramoylalanine--D-glutamate ligase
MELRGRKVTVVGLGRFGGGLGAARYALGQGAQVTVTDLKGPDELAESVVALEDEPVTMHLGGHREEDFREADVVIVSPAVPKDSPMLAVAREAGAALTSEMNLFLEQCPARVAAVTGSAGKSTTAALLARALAARYRVHFGGNIGRSLLQALPEIEPADLVCLELSSFQLEDAAALKWSPHVAVVTNLSPNHIDRHGSMAAYAAAKQNILRFQTADDFAVLPAAPDDAEPDDFGVSGWDALTRARVLRFSARQRPGDGACLEGDRAVIALDGRREEVPLGSALRLPGRHNATNFLAAALAARLAGVPLAETAEATCGFTGLPHRLVLAAEIGDVAYYDDSKATTPAAARVALEAFGDRPVIAIAGGYDKRIDLRPLADALVRHAKAVMLIGQTAPALAEMLAARGHPHSEVAGTLERAVARIAETARPGDVVLLSPGHASWDQFASYEERGERFAMLVLGQDGRLAGAMGAAQNDKGKA